MRLPDALQQAIRDEVSRMDAGAVARACVQLTERYKRADYTRAPLDSVAARLAYLQVRMPATFVANAHVFRELAGIEGIGSMLDLGAGPGTSMWAAAEVFPSIERFTLVERDRELGELGGRLAWHSSNNAVRTARWEVQDLNGPTELEAHDLVVFSYALGELSPATGEQLLRLAWGKAAKLLVIIEPGKPRNFTAVLSSRKSLLELGAYPAAPCPHSAECPMAVMGDWCHFSERLQRTAEHRRMKSGSLGYEDEKFSYYAAAKSEIQLPQSRIVRHPMKHKGHVQLTLCTPTGLKRRTVAKSERELYKRARNAEWGDGWNEIDA